ncbi:MAG: hypothetical protein HY336_00375 [Candidatus Doudnabacteria bacterium]|nr:hypothetical protein [Candidatus Doudnabacteria bacterium]
MKENILTIVVIIILTGALYFIFRRGGSSPPRQTISNFGECAKAGYPIGESFPRQCWTPDGKRFVEGQ